MGAIKITDGAFNATRATQEDNNIDSVTFPNKKARISKRSIQIITTEESPREKKTDSKNLHHLFNQATIIPNQLQNAINPEKPQNDQSNDDKLHFQDDTISNYTNTSIKFHQNSPTKSVKFDQNSIIISNKDSALSSLNVSRTQIRAYNQSQMSLNQSSTSIQRIDDDHNDSNEYLDQQLYTPSNKITSKLLIKPTLLYSTKSKRESNGSIMSYIDKSDNNTQVRVVSEYGGFLGDGSFIGDDQSSQNYFRAGQIIVDDLSENNQSEHQVLTEQDNEDDEDQADFNNEVNKHRHGKNRKDVLQNIKIKMDKV